MSRAGAIYPPTTTPRSKVVHTYTLGSGDKRNKRNGSASSASASVSESASAYDNWRDSLSPVKPHLASAETIAALYDRKVVTTAGPAGSQGSPRAKAAAAPTSSSQARKNTCITDKLNPFLYDNTKAVAAVSMPRSDSVLRSLVQQLREAADSHLLTFRHKAPADLFVPVANPASETVCQARGHLSTMGAAWHGAQSRSLQKLSELMHMRDMQRQTNNELRSQCAHQDKLLKNILNALPHEERGWGVDADVEAEAALEHALALGRAALRQAAAASVQEQDEALSVLAPAPSALAYVPAATSLQRSLAAQALPASPDRPSGCPVAKEAGAAVARGSNLSALALQLFALSEAVLPAPTHAAQERSLQLQNPLPSSPPQVAWSPPVYRQASVPLPEQQQQAIMQPLVRALPQRWEQQEWELDERMNAVLGKRPELKPSTPLRARASAPAQPAPTSYRTDVGDSSLGFSSFTSPNERAPPSERLLQLRQSREKLRQELNSTD